MTGALRETPEDLAAHLEAAVCARQRLRTRPLRDTIATLAAAAPRWAADRVLLRALPETARLSPAMVATILPVAAEALTAAAMTALVERECGAGAVARPAAQEPVLVAHILASNVPALAVPAIALACLAGAAVLVKSGRDDPLSAPAFVRALAAVDPDLAATVVTAYWRGGDRAHEEAVLSRAGVVVATGGDPALAALRGRVRGRFVAHGPRMSVAAIGRDATANVIPALAWDIALHDQRGCLSPQAVYVDTAGAVDPRTFAARLADALGELAGRLPPGPAGVAERAAGRAFREQAEWTPGTEVFATDGGTVVYDEHPELRPTCGLRTVRVHPLASLATLPALIAPGTVECVGLAGSPPPALAAALREAGVSRICPPGRMQRPPLAWARGQQAPLGALFGRPGAPRLDVET